MPNPPIPEPTAAAVSPDAAMIDRRFSIAPMLDWTDRHARYFLRLASPNIVLYTEMVTAAALINGDRQRFLGFDPAEHPLALQLGGSDAEALARCAALAEAAGFDEVNLNVGCPSDRVQSGRFGACLMAEPALVADCVSAMRGHTGLPVTVKCRIGIDHHDDHAFFRAFVDTVAEAGCDTFIVHARKAWLKGLSPKQNREIPPLHYDTVYRLKAERPDLVVVINGGITDLDQAVGHLAHVDGVMLGRAPFQDPAMLFDVDRRLFGARTEPVTRAEVFDRYLDYAKAALARGVGLRRLAAPLFGLFQGQPGARAFRRHLSENAGRPGAGVAVLREAAARAFDHRQAA